MRFRGLVCSLCTVIALAVALPAFSQQDPCATVFCDEPPGNSACVENPGRCVIENGIAVCVYAAINNGGPCSDRNACTTGDVCANGECVGVPTVCPGGDGVCSLGFCDTVSGNCSLDTAPDGTLCNDNVACTQNDACSHGVCSGSPYECATPAQCKVAGTCNGDGSCSFVNQPDGSPCDDGNACTSHDSCTNGECHGSSTTCTPPDDCHVVATCDASGCTFAPKADGSPCNDGSACTTGDSCQAGSCLGVPVACDPADQCHEAGVCGADGKCSYVNKSDGTACDDGNACTLADSCQSGQCTGGNVVACSALDSCHDVGQCDPHTGVCSNPVKPNGSACGDGGGDVCTIGGFCQDGACQASTCSTCTCEVKGAGQTNTATGGLATFSFNVKNKTTGNPDGTFSWVNHDAKCQIKGKVTKATACSDTHSATLEGTCGKTCTFVVRVHDGTDDDEDDSTIDVSSTSACPGTGGDKKVIRGNVKLDCSKKNR